MLGNHFVDGNYYLNYEEKKLFIYDKLVAEGESALDYAFELLPPSEWTRLDEAPMMVEMRLEDEEYPY